MTLFLASVLAEAGVQSLPKAKRVEVRTQRMSHVYQPVMLRLLLDRNGRATVGDIARALLNEDRSQLEYYSEITRNMVGRVLANRKVVVRQGGDYELLGSSELSPE